MLSRSIVLSIALLFIASTCYCQKHQVGVHITPSQSFRKLNRESSTSKFDDKIIVVNYGVDYKLELADKVSLYSGLAISTLGYDEATVLKDVKHEHRYHYIDLPVGIEYQLLSTGKFAIAISADIQLNKLFKVTRRTEGNDDLIPDFTIKG